MNTVQKMVLIPLERYKLLQITREPLELTDDKPIRETPLETKVISEQIGEGNALSEEVILASVPKPYKYKVRGLLMHMKNDPHKILSWNEKGELVYRGRVISGSHISDLLKDTQRHYKQFSPHGVEEFRQGLEELHVPIGLLGNKLGTIPANSSDIKKTLHLEPKIVTSFRPPGLPNRPTKKKSLNWISI